MNISIHFYNMDSRFEINEEDIRANLPHYRNYRNILIRIISKIEKEEYEKRIEKERQSYARETLEECLERAQDRNSWIFEDFQGEWIEEGPKISDVKCYVDGGRPPDDLWCRGCYYLRNGIKDYYGTYRLKGTAFYMCGTCQKPRFNGWEMDKLKELEPRYKTNKKEKIEEPSKKEGPEKVEKPPEKKVEPNADQDISFDYLNL